MTEVSSANSVTLISVAIDRFHKYNESVRKSAATERWYKGALSQFTRFAGEDITFDRITQDLLDDYRLELVRRGLAADSANNYLRALKAFLAWAKRRHYLSECPAIEMVRSDANLAPPAYFTDEEISKLLEATREESTTLLKLRAKAIILTLISTGMRASELCSARWLDLKEITVDGQPAHVLEIKGAKRGGLRSVVLNQDAWEAIKAYRENLAQPHGQGYKQRGSNPAWLFVSHRNFDGPLTVNGLEQILTRLGRVSGVHCHPHKFRHHFAREWVAGSEGLEDRTLMALAGWKSPEMVTRYAGAYQEATLVKAHRRNVKKVRRAG